MVQNMVKVLALATVYTKHTHKKMAALKMIKIVTFFDPVAKQNLSESVFFEASSSNLEHNSFRFINFIFLQF